MTHTSRLFLFLPRQFGDSTLHCAVIYRSVPISEYKMKLTFRTRSCTFHAFL